MSSSVFYKFKNSREPERIVFDGTGISVFELKREIIVASGLGNGEDFDLHLYPEDSPTSEYDDDTTIISRSSTVIAVRRPAARGHGRAARYVSGRAPVRAIKKAETKTTAAPAVGAPLTEEDAQAAFLAESAQVWDAQKETLAHLSKPTFKKKPVNVPTHDPPPGYICYRCHKKGHWIQACPTNDDPNHKSEPRTKRTTGIPRSFLKTVEKPIDEEAARGVMLNADGEYVQVLTDTRTWEKFQEKTNASKAQAASADAANKEVRERGLECSIDKRMFVDPAKTPCCGKTYCRDCIENALADGDLVCPNCSADNTLIDDLLDDVDMVQKIKAYETEKAKEKLDKGQRAIEETKAAAKASTPSNNEVNNSVLSTDQRAKAGVTAGSKSPQPNNTSSAKSPLTVAALPTPSSGGDGSDTDTSTTLKKRKEPPTEIKPPTAPKAMRQKAQDPTVQLTNTFQQDMEALKNGILPMRLPNASMAMTSPMNMSASAMPMNNPMMGMINPPNMNGMHPMAHMNGMNGMNNMNGYGGWNGYQGGQPNNMGYNMNQGWSNGGYGGNMGGYNNNMHPMGNMNAMGGGYNPGWNQGQGPNQGGYGNVGWQGNGQGQMGHQGPGNFPNPQGRVFNEQANPQDAYERKPVNPHRSQNKHRKQRAPDFHYV